MSEAFNGCKNRDCFSQITSFNNLALQSITITWSHNVNNHDHIRNYDLNLEVIIYLLDAVVSDRYTAREL